jgi:NAD-dependent glycerol-3-phosphate dehydrogenase C-terminus
VAQHAHLGTTKRRGGLTDSVHLQVIEGKLTCVVAASKKKELARQVQALFAQGNMRISLSKDVQGVEICGALKNVLAIAAGIVEGKGLGSNALAAVVRFMELLPTQLQSSCSYCTATQAAPTVFSPTQATWDGGSGA